MGRTSRRTSVVAALASILLMLLVDSATTAAHVYDDRATRAAHVSGAIGDSHETLDDTFSVRFLAFGRGYNDRTNLNPANARVGRGFLAPQTAVRAPRAYSVSPTRWSYLRASWAEAARCTSIERTLPWTRLCRPMRRSLLGWRS